MGWQRILRCYPASFAVTPFEANGFIIATTDGFTVGYMLSPLSWLKNSEVNAIGQLCSLQTAPIQLPRQIIRNDLFPFRT